MRFINGNATELKTSWKLYHVAR